MNQNPEKIEPRKLIEGVDYYLENGFWVFTTHYLLNRGYCCNSGCRHCPYRETKPNIISSSPDPVNDTPHRDTEPI
jgi:hypothetical protein